jgi:hypothetical protein
MKPLIVLLIVAGICDARLLFVSGSASSIPPSAVSAKFSTLPAALSIVQAHDTILLDQGTYADQGGYAIPVGVYLKGAGADKTIFQGSGAYACIRLISDNLTDGNQALSGFMVQGNNKALEGGILVRGRSNVRLHDLKVEWTNHYGIQVTAHEKTWNGSLPRFFCTGIEIFNTVLLNCSRDESGWSRGALLIGGLEGAHIHHMTINEKDGYGIKFWEEGFLRRLTINDCSITTNESDPSWGADAIIELWNVYDNSEVYNISGNQWISLVNNNVPAGSVSTRSIRLHHCRTISARADNPKEAVEVAIQNGEIDSNYFEHFKMGFGIWGKTLNNTMHHNVLRCRSAIQWGAGAWVEGQSVDHAGNKIYNNVFDGFERGIWFKPLNSRVTDMQIKNNLIMNCREGAFAFSNNAGTVTNVVASNNALINAPVEIRNYTSHQIQFTPVNTLKPSTSGLKLTGSIPDPWYRPISADGALVDKGIAVGLPYAGDAPDIGAYEFENAVSTDKGHSVWAGTVRTGPGPDVTGWFLLSGRKCAALNIRAGVYIKGKIGRESMVHYATPKY